MRKGQLLLLGMLAALLIATPFVAAQEDEEKLISPLTKLASLAQKIGYPLGVVVLMFSAGMGTIFKAGDPTAIDELKRKVRNVSIGILIIALAGTIVNVIQGLVG